MDERYEPIDLSAWRVRELPSNFADDVVARLDALDRSLAEELEVIDDELGDTLHAIDDDLEAVRPRASVHALPRPSKRPVLLATVLATVLAAAAATLVLVWPEPPPPAVAVPAPLSVAAPPPTIAVAPTIAAAEAELDRGGIRRAVTEQFVPKARACYNALLGRDPAAQGRVTLRFAVVRDGERGVVEDCAVHEAGTDMADTLFRGCLVDGMRTVVFEAPTGEGRVTIEYPFVFKTGANGEALVSQ